MADSTDNTRELLAAAVARFDDRGHIFAGRYPHHEGERERYRVRADAALAALREAGWKDPQQVAGPRTELGEERALRRATLTERDRARSERNAARTAIAELLRLKDGPRDAAYAMAKPIVWAAARSALSDVDLATEPIYACEHEQWIEDHAAIRAERDALLDLRDKARAWRRTLEGRVVLTYGATTAALIAAVDALEEDRRG